MELNISLSASKKPIFLSSIQPTALTKNPTVLIKRLYERQEGPKFDIFSHQTLTILSKVGLKTANEINTAASAFINKATAEELKAFLSPKVKETLVKGLTAKFSLYRKSKFSYKFKVSTVSAKTTTEAFTRAVYQFAYVAHKLCTALGVPYTDAVVSYMITGTGKAPSALKALAKFKADATKDVSDDRTLFDFTVKDFKVYNPLLAAGLPKIFAEMVTEVKKKSGKKKSAKERKYPTSRWVASIENSKRRTKAAEAVANQLKEKVSAELFHFYMLNIPALKEALTDTKELKKKIASAQKDAQAAARVLKFKRKRLLTKFEANLNQAKKGLTGPLTPAKKAQLAALQQKYKEEDLELREEVKELSKNSILLKAELRDGVKNNLKKMKSWMIPYAPSSTDLSIVRGASKAIDPGILAHRLVVKANSGKLKADAVELKAVLDKTSVLTLTYRGVGSIIESLGSSVKAAKTIFANCLDQVKPKMFAIAVDEHQGGTFILKTDLGDVTDKRLLQLNNITKAEEDAILEQFAAEFKAWNPLKQEADAVAKSLIKTTTVKAGKMTAIPVSDVQVKSYNNDVQQFKSNLHSVGLKVIKAWDVTPSKKALAALKNMKGSADVQVIRNVFHGCSRQTGSIILHSGFKISGTMVTARAMGDVLYMAPCIDKSAQYLGGRGHSRRVGTTGIIFMGDILVAGNPSSKPKKGEKRSSSFAWTKTKFATEEIGLVNPNMQFIIRHAFLVSVTSATTSAQTDQQKLMSKFENPISIKNYSLT